MATGAPRGRETAAAAVAAVVATAVAGLSSVVVQVADGVAGYAVFVILVALALTLFWVAGRSLLRARASRPAGHGAARGSSSRSGAPLTRTRSRRRGPAPPRSEDP